jgi:DNA repair protein RadC
MTPAEHACVREAREILARYINSNPVYPREIIRTALELDAQALILAHNHPSGDAGPSRTDLILTRQLVEAARLFDLTVHDHLVVAGPAHHSLRASNEEIFR